MKYAGCKAADKYAHDVVSGKQPAGRWIIAACQRHLDDLEKQKDDSFKFYFDSAKAEKAIKFIELMPHTKGKWALKKETLRLEPWQKFFVANVFGWCKKKNGYRRFRRAQLWVPRKNGKSALAAAIGNYMLTADGEYGAEVYSGATTEKQAMEVFRPAQIMVRKTPALREAFNVEVNASNMCIVESGSKFEPIVGNPGDGSSPHCAIIDEYHEHKDDRAVDTMETGMGAREQPLLLMITTAGDNISGPCYAAQLDAQKMLEGAVKDDTTFALIYGVDAGYSYDIKSPMNIIGKIDQCQLVNSVEVQSNLAAAFVKNAISGIGTSTELLEREVVKTIQTGQFSAKGFASLAMKSRESIAQKKNEKSATSTQISGQKIIRISEGQQLKNGRSLKKEERQEGAPMQSNTGLPLKSMTLLSQLESAKFAGSLKKTFALITAMIRELSGECCVKSATLESVCLETLTSVSLEPLVISKDSVLHNGVLTVEVEADDWKSVKAMKKANPNYGISVNEDFLKDQLAKAKNSPRKQSAYQTKHLNIWVGSKDAFYNLDKWNNCASDIKIEDYYGRRAYIGLDLASKVDIAALEILIELEDSKFAHFSKHYLPYEAAQLEHYIGWMREGFLEVTDGEIIDYAEIEADIMDICGKFEVAEVAYDPFQATMLATRLMDAGVPVVEMGATVKNFSEPMKELDAIIRDNRIVHNGNPVFTWMLSNVTGKIDKKDNVFPNKERPENKIDGPVALMMALGRYMNDNQIDISYAINNPVSFRL